MNIRQFLSTSISIVAAMSLSGCAAILGGGPATPVRLNSDPPGAKVYDNGVFVATTPAEVSVSKKTDHAFEFRKDGYTSSTRMVQSSASGGWIVCDVLLTGLIGVVVDAATQDWNGLSQDFVTVSLEAASKN